MADRLQELEQEILRLRKINKALMERVEDSINNSRDDFALFEQNIQLQRHVDQRTRELEEKGQQLAATLEQQRRTINQLAESQKRYDQLAEQSRTITWEIDAQGRYTHVSSMLEPILGYRPEELAGRFLFHSLPPENNPDDVRSPEQVNIQTIIQRGEPFTEIIRKVMTRSGKTIWLSSNGIPCHDAAGNPSGYWGIDTDITHRRLVEEASEKRLAALTRPMEDIADISFEELFNLEDIQRLQDDFALATGVASSIYRPDGTPITKPSNFTRFCGTIIRATEKGRANCYRSGSEIGRYSEHGPTIQHCLSAGLWDAGAGITVGGRHIANWVIGQVRDETQSEENMRAYARMIGADEEDLIQAFREVPSLPLRRFKQIAQALYTLSRQLSAFAYQNVQQARFIAERRQAEAEREQLHAQLLQAHKMESVGILAGGIAHDFNNLLQAMSGNIELLLRGKPDNHPDAPRLKTAAKSMSRAGRLVGQLLQFSRKIESQKIELDLNLELTEAVQMLKGTIPKMIDLKLEADPSVWAIFADPIQIEQVLLNLVNNAADAMQGHGQVRLLSRNVILDSEFVAAHPGTHPGRHVLVSVIDTGCGMEQDIAQHVFDPFFTTKEVGKGTGLGLASVYGIVKNHGGYIQCLSEPGQGTTFNIYLPALEHTAHLYKEKAADQGAPLGGSETILIVDDEPEILELTMEALESLGYATKGASSGEQALEIFRQDGQAINLVLLDLNMPGMGGLKCMEELLRLDPALKILVTSGYSASGYGGESLKCGAKDFIGKPYQLPELQAKVRKVLDQ